MKNGDGSKWWQLTRSKIIALCMSYIWITSKPFQSVSISKAPSPPHVLTPDPVHPENATLWFPPVFLPAAACVRRWADRGWQSSLRRWGLVQRSGRWPAGTKRANKESKTCGFNPQAKTRRAVTKPLTGPTVINVPLQILVLTFT